MVVNIEVTLQMAVKAHKLGELERAKYLYRKIIEKDFKNVHAIHNLGLLIAKENKTEEALGYFKQALEINNNILQFWLSYIDSLIQLGRKEEAKILLKSSPPELNLKNKIHMDGKNISSQKQHSLTHTPNELRSRLDKLILFYREGNYQRIINECNKLDVVNSNNADIINIVAAASAKLHRLKDAKALYSKLTKLKPEFNGGYTNLGSILEKLSRPSEAIVNFQKAIVLKPEHMSVYCNLGNALVRQDKNKKAMSFFKKASVLDVISPIPYNDLGNAMVSIRQNKVAISNYIKAVQLAPNLAAIYNNIGSALTKDVQYKDALKFFKIAANVDPTLNHLYANSGNVLEKLGLYQKAIRNFKKSIILVPSSVESIFSLGLANHRDEKKGASLQNFDWVLKIQPTHDSARHLSNAIHGNTTKTAPSEYIERFFDNYANTFEDHLTKQLNYETPKRLRKLYNKNFPNPSKLANVLDLGCGTGLSGVSFKSLCEKLIGIDISSGMIEEAKKKNLYDELIHGEIVDTLLKFSKNREKVDLFICTDVLVYIGDCNQLFSLVSKTANKSAVFVFSTEDTKEPGFKLLETGRYAHSYSYIDECADRWGFEIVDYKTSVIRKEKVDQYINGNFFVLKKAIKIV